MVSLLCAMSYVIALISTATMRSRSHLLSCIVRKGFLAGSVVKNPLAMQEMQVRSLGKGMATHCSIPAWEIPWAEEPGGT